MTDSDHPNEKRERAKQEIDSMPAHHVESVIEHVNQLRGTRSGDSERANADQRDLYWECHRCGYRLPRGSEQPEQCPDCGAPREEIMLNEAEI